ncbi:MAG: hypothetical protein AAB887_02155 [Patescibacteria group bacterium]
MPSEFNLADFYTGREFRDRRIAESAEPWPSLIKRLPKLARGADTSHIHIAHGGGLIPFADAQKLSGRLPFLSNQFHCELTGGPKAGKGLFGKYIAYELARKRIGHVVYEERQPEITPETNLVSFNLCLQLLAAAAMDAVVIFHVDPQKSIFRGSSVKEDYLDLLAKSFKSLPEKIARSWTGNCGLAIIEIDANKLMRPYHDLALRSVGTLLQSMLDMYGTSETLEDMLGDE